MSKIKKKDLHMKEDAFMGLIDKIRLFVEQNKQWFIYGASALVLLLIVIVGFTNYKRYAENKAQNLEKSAYAIFFNDYLELEEKFFEQFSDEEDIEKNEELFNEMKENKINLLNKAVNEYSELYKRYPSTRSGERALFMMGYINHKLNNDEISYDHLKRYYRRYGKNGIFFIPCIKNIASIYEMREEANTAIDFLEGILKSRGFLHEFPADTLLLQLGILYLNEGNYETAVEKFELIEKNYPNSMLIGDANRYISFGLYNLKKAGPYDDSLNGDEKSLISFIKRPGVVNGAIEFDHDQAIILEEEMEADNKGINEIRDEL